jgi:hypothetical protein
MSPIRDIDVTVIMVCALTNISGITPSHVIGRSRGHKASVLSHLVRRQRSDNGNNSPRFDTEQAIKIASLTEQASSPDSLLLLTTTLVIVIVIIIIIIIII